MSQASKTIAIIIPTYNERDNIKPLVEKLHKALSGLSYEVVFIDDNSADGTADVINSLSSRFPIRVIVRKDEKGLASAVVHGLGNVNGDVLCVMDADLQHPPETIPELISAINKGADVAIASRYVEGGSCQEWSLLRRLESKGATFLAHIFLTQTRKIEDPMSGFFALTPMAIRGVDLKPSGYKILLEILAKGKPTQVKEVPYTFKSRTAGVSKLQISQQLDYLKHLYQLMRTTGEFNRIIKYCLVGASGVIVDEGIFWALTSFAGIFNILSAAVSAEAAIVSNFTLNNYFTFADRRLPGAKAFLVRFLKFNAVSLTGIGIKLAVFWLLSLVFGIHDLIFNLCGIAVATVWNYIANTWWTWK